MAESYSDLTKDPIPLGCGNVAGWKEVPLRPTDEPLVALGQFTARHTIFTDSIYYGERTSSPYPTASLNGSLITHFTRESVASALVKAQELLPKTMRLVTFDTYRTLQVQQSLYDTYLSALQQLHPTWTDEQLSAETQKYVSIPSGNPERPSPHNTAGSVDAAIVEVPEDVAAGLDKVAGHDDEWVDMIARHATMLNFGTPFDHGGPESALSYMERLAANRKLAPDEREALLNRRLLYRVMVEVGMQPYADEWWHFNTPQSQMGARADGRSQATFGAALLTDDHLQHEYNRRQHYQERILRYMNGESTVNPVVTTIGRAAIIAPPSTILPAA